MKYQRFVSLSAGLAFVVMFISSWVLYFVPDRGSTSWSGWCFLGLDKQQWDNLHISLGLLFLVLLVWHIYFNWKPIKNYLKVKKELKIFTKEFNASLLLVSLFMVGTLTMTLPFSFFVNFGNGMKAMHLKDGENPPFAYAELTRLKDFCKIAKIDLKNAEVRLSKNSIKLDSTKETLKEIALQNSTTPREIYNIIKDENTRFALPSSIPTGIAHQSLNDLEILYRFDAKSFLRSFKSDGFKGSADMSFKKIAKVNHLHPAKLYGMLLGY